ncbi:MAG: class I SAM-dependent methyltransferase [Candidatus Levybacteria bacterium]|nr:class I SAM-dependent methyltransferase [Candidatus Levybacteria bacterium]
MVPINYGGRIESRGPETYRSQSLLDTIFQATGLENFQGSAVVIDLMSGPGGIALNLQKKASRHSYAVLDYDQEQLAKIGEHEPVNKILADVRNVSSVVKGESVDIATARYGIKDIPQGQQLQALKGINEILRPGGVFVLTDMISLEGEGLQRWLNIQHSQKQQLSGREIEKEGECYIPTEKEWLAMLKEVGFEAEVFGYYTSPISTGDWLTGNQFGNPKSPEAARKKAIMDEIIMNAPEGVKKAFNVRQGVNGMEIDYPVVIIRAVKKVAESGLPTAGDLYAAS